MVSDPPIENIEEQEVFQETISEEQPPLIPKVINITYFYIYTIF